ncbi:hypothetical protein ACFFQW_38610 [Umezawaea endophytica]|uniref:Uncharacterized protein n=1 Tax=Umezawaea endophytica TaxID=1654476 RepID=A0A9X2VVX7_9PSEU|nr:hypothetical protein [Umezawaea endophytica]MCS7482994.1 hypothetical protein [Umezawaea endophytica]
MAEHDPFTSPYHQVRLPGEPQAQPPPDWVSPVLTPMPSSPWGDAEFRRPATLIASFWCWLAATVLAVVGLPTVFAFQHQEFAQVMEARTDGEPVSEAVANATALAMAGMFALALAVLAVPYVVALVNLRNGKEWSRIMLAVLCGPALLFWLVTMVVVANAPEGLSPSPVYAWGALFLATMAAAAVLMFLPPSNDYVRWSRR